jgi:endonuclease/exonuclease/phosphatase family metal-dependent hydrolase
MSLKTGFGAAVLLLACGAIVLRSDAARAEEALAVKIMTFNIRYDNSGDGPNRWAQRREAAVDVIRRFAGDFIGIQEALPHQVADLQKALPDYRQLGRSREADAQRGESTPILYRHERWRLDPEQSGWFWLSDTPETAGSTTWNNVIPRMVVWARFIDEKTGRGLYVFNTHFDHLSEPSRRKSAELLARRIIARKSTEPVVVVGDFNAGEASFSIRYLTGQEADSPLALVDTFRALHADEKQVGTFHGFRGGTDKEKIDYVLASPGAKVLKAEILRDRIAGEDRYPSDHYPVTAELSLPEGEPSR